MMYQSKEYPQYQYEKKPVDMALTVTNTKTGHQFQMTFSRMDDLLAFLNYRTIERGKL